MSEATARRGQGWTPAAPRPSGTEVDEAKEDDEDEEEVRWKRMMRTHV